MSENIVDNESEIEHPFMDDQNDQEGHGEHGDHGERERAGADEKHEPVARVARSASKSASASPSASRPRPVRRGTPRARRMNLSLTRLDAWSVAKVTFMMSIAGGIIQVVATAIIWLMLNVVGVFDQITQMVSSTGLDAGGLDLENVFTLSTVLSAVTIFSIIEVVVITLLMSIVALIYNVVSSLVGGIHVTLGDD
ncbi:DUF3566 domain-containing protein [Bifidobacterium eulemuris]|uniref:DUF3566 domain-containing protein n=1 Tax=Bifidobacterium eulemuris TaxID=1765219 RepID=A0A261G1D3_9BIFI|nr:DUF3566 domain-containing protein [Bifidobacterium eulemuris]OZG65249.1 hypothetical protein BEUL_1992 [Bifidobacterium eulemuris]QOL32332.1 DUF3566 domain-containing protein [Bifidobacterium eulemuris]